MEEGDRMSREGYNSAKADIAAPNVGLRQAQVVTSDEDEDEEDYEGVDSPHEDAAPEGTGSLVQAMLAQAQRQLREGADGKDLPQVPPQDVEADKRLVITLTPVQVPGPTKPTTTATSADGRKVVLTRVLSDAPVLQDVTPAGMETVSQEERDDYWVIVQG